MAPDEHARADLSAPGLTPRPLGPGPPKRQYGQSLTRLVLARLPGLRSFAVFSGWGVWIVTIKDNRNYPSKSEQLFPDGRQVPAALRNASKLRQLYPKLTGSSSGAAASTTKISKKTKQPFLKNVWELEVGKRNPDIHPTSSPAPHPAFLGFKGEKKRVGFSASPSTETIQQAPQGQRTLSPKL